MRKFLSLLVGSILFFSCQKSQAPSVLDEGDAIKRTCATDEVLKAQLAEDPTLADRMNSIEAFTQKLISSGNLRTAGTIEIPVVVHVLYNAAVENISDAQVASQIDVLNEDYNLKNSDNTQVPSLFSGVKANVGVHFTLARTIRKKTSKKSWGTNDAVKSSRNGGDDAVDPAHNLNIWVCNLGQGLLGYAQFPGGKAATDGVVILYKAFGRTGTLIVPYDKGRTASHEVGHWMNLRHIWGDATCGDDLVGDTPKHTTANYGCPAFPHNNSCSDHAVEMTMNYMDYTDDPCMYMFSNGQKSRMLAVFAAGGPRASFAP
jgi:hypothetical protein